jgi:GGDEF domain-containing protein
MLREITACLKNCAAETDTVARVGGDEFVCIAGVQTADAAAALATRMRIALDSGGAAVVVHRQYRYQSFPSGRR